MTDTYRSLFFSGQLDDLLKNNKNKEGLTTKDIYLGGNVDKNRSNAIIQQSQGYKTQNWDTYNPYSRQQIDPEYRLKIVGYRDDKEIKPTEGASLMYDVGLGMPSDVAPKKIKGGSLYSGVFRVHIPSTTYKKPPNKPVDISEAADTVAVGDYHTVNKDGTASVFDDSGKDIFIKVDNLTRAEINERVEELLRGYKKRYNKGFPHLPLDSSPEEPIEFINYGQDMQIKINKRNPIGKYKIGPNTLVAARMALRAVQGAEGLFNFGFKNIVAGGFENAGHAINFGVNLLRGLGSETTLTRPGDPLSLFGAAVSRIQAIPEDVKYKEKRRPDVKGNFWANPTFNNWSDMISRAGTKTGNSVSTVVTYPSRTLEQAFKYGISIIPEDDRDGTYAFSGEDYREMFASDKGGFLENLIPDLFLNRGFSWAINRMGVTPEKAKIFNTRLSGNKKLDKEMTEVVEWGEQNGFSKWKSGKQLWIEEQKKVRKTEKDIDDASLLKEWNKMHPAEQTHYLNRAASTFIEMKIAKDGGWMKGLNKLTLQGRVETGKSVPAHYRQTRLNDTYSAVGGTVAAQTLGEEFYLIGAIPAAIINPSVLKSSVSRLRDSRIGGGIISSTGGVIKRGVALTAGIVDSIADVNVDSAFDALYAAWFRKVPATEKQFADAKKRIKDKNPDISDEALIDAVYMEEGLIDPNGTFVLPQFYYIDKNGEKKLAETGSPEHNDIKNLMTDLNKITDPDSRQLVVNELKYFLKLQNKLSDLAEKFPVEGDPMNHPLRQLSGALYEAMPLFSTRALAESVAEEANLSVMGRLKLAEAEQIFLKRKELLNRLGVFVKNATDFVGKDALLNDINPVVQKLSNFIDYENQLVDRMQAYAKTAPEIRGKLFGSNLYKQSTDYMEVNPPDDDELFELIVTSFGDPKNKREAVEVADNQLRDTMRSIVNHTTHNKRLWNDANRNKIYKDKLSVINNSISTRAALIYEPFKTAKPIIVSDETSNQFFTTVVNRLTEDKEGLSILTKEKIKGNHGYGAYKIFKDITQEPAERIRNQLKMVFKKGEEESMAAYNARVSEEIGVNINNNIDLVYYAINSNDIAAGPLKQAVGFLEITSDTAIKMDRHFKGTLFELKKKLKEVGDKDKTIEPQIKAYEDLLGDETGLMEGSLTNLIRKNSNAEVFNKYLKASELYKEEIAPSRWGEFWKDFEGVKNIEYKKNGYEINYKLSHKQALGKLGKLIFEDPDRAWDVLSKKFGRPVYTKEGERLGFAITTDYEASAFSSIVTQSINQHLDNTVSPKIEQLISKYGSDFKGAENDQLYRDIGQMTSMLAPGGKFNNIIEKFSEFTKIQPNFHLYNGKLNPDGSQMYEPINQFAFRKNTKGKVLDTLDVFENKKMYDYDDTMEKMYVNEIKHIIENNKGARKAYDDYQDSLRNASIKFSQDAESFVKRKDRQHQEFLNTMNRYLGIDKIVGGKAVLQLDQAVESLAQSGLSNVKRIEKELIDAKTDKNKFVFEASNQEMYDMSRKLGVDKIEKEKAREIKVQQYLAKLIRYKFIEDCFGPETIRATTTNPITKSLEQTDVKVPVYSNVMQAKEKYGSLLEEYMDSDYYDLFSTLAEKFSIKAGGQDFGDEAVQKGMSRVLRNIPRSMSVEGGISRGWGLTRGVIGWRWVGSEMAFRAARTSNVGSFRVLLNSEIPIKGQKDKTGNVVNAMIQMLENGNITKTNHDILIRNIPELIANSNLELAAWEGFEADEAAILKARKRPILQPDKTLLDSDRLYRLEGQLDKLLQGF